MWVLIAVILLVVGLVYFIGAAITLFCTVRWHNKYIKPYDK